MSQDLGIRPNGVSLPFAVAVRGLNLAERELLSQLVAPYWMTGPVVDDGEEVVVRLVRGGVEDSATLTVPAVGDVDTTVLRVIDMVRVVVKVALVRTRGGMNCHTGAVDIGGRGVLFTGRRGAGKTTVLRSCAAAGLGLVANDQCVVVLDADELRAVGAPALMAVRPDSRWPRFELPAIPIATGADAQDGTVRKRYDLPSVARVNGTTCVPQTIVRLLVSYEGAAGSNVLDVVREPADVWVATAAYDLAEAYSPALVDVAVKLSGLAAAEATAELRSTMTAVPHYRVTCSADMVDRVPDRFIDLVGVPSS